MTFGDPQISRRGQRGVTLVELLIAMVVVAVVMVGVAAMAITQQNAYQNGHRNREAQDAVRMAMLDIDKNVRRAGYGIDPAYAFDFIWYGTLETIDSTLCQTPMQTSSKCVRDSTGNADELIFYARNPYYWVPNNPNIEPRGNAWRIGTPPSSPPGPTTSPYIDAVGNKITLEAHLGDRFLKGQILELVCLNAAAYAFVTVGANTTAAGTNAATVAVPLATDTTGTDPFMRQDVAVSGATGGCFNSGFARAFLVDRYRYHVEPVPEPGVSGGYEPYLMLDTGVDRNADNTVNSADEIAVAPGVEDLQVGYGFLNDSSQTGWGGPIPTAGVDGGVITLTPESTPSTWGGTTANTITTTTFSNSLTTGFTNGTSTGTPYQLLSWYQWPLPPIGAARLGNNQANIASVTVALVGRSYTPDFSSSTTYKMDSTFSLLNQSGVPAWITSNPNRGAGDDGFKRFKLTTSIPLSNYTARSVTFF